MCTLSYCLTPDGYQLFFNRDEQRSRAHAIPPKFDDEIQAIYPVDAKAGGSWMGVSVSGVSVALLNYYQADQLMPPPRGDEISRGQLVLLLLSLKDNAGFYLQQLDLTRYRPFSVFIINPRHDIDFFSWDGEVLTEPDIKLPITSSSVDIQKVVDSRSQQFASIVGDKTEANLFRRFHFSRVEQGHCSVNMCRPDARTMSISAISVSRESVVFDYFDNITKTRFRRRANRDNFDNPALNTL